MKAIIATDIRVGDTVKIAGRNDPVTVGRVRLLDTFKHEYHPKVLIVSVIHDVTYEVDADAIVDLVGRPWCEGTTAWDMLTIIELLAHRIHELRGFGVGTSEGAEPSPELARVIEQLRDAIEAYELGKPEPLSDDVHPEGEASCGYLGGGFVVR